MSRVLIVSRASLDTFGGSSGVLAVLDGGHFGPVGWTDSPASHDRVSFLGAEFNLEAAPGEALSAWLVLRPAPIFDVTLSPVERMVKTREQARILGDHVDDEDCTVGEANVCVECGVGHSGPPCVGCGTVAFHREDCPELAAELGRVDK